MKSVWLPRANSVPALSFNLLGAMIYEVTKKDHSAFCVLPGTVTLLVSKYAQKIFECRSVALNVTD